MLLPQQNPSPHPVDTVTQVGSGHLRVWMGWRVFERAMWHLLPSHHGDRVEVGLMKPQLESLSGDQLLVASGSQADLED